VRRVARQKRWHYETRRIEVLCCYAGLAMTMNIQQEEYVTEAGDTAGVVVVIQPQRQMPFPEDDGTLVSPGFATSIAIAQVRQQRLHYGGDYPVNISNRTLTMRCLITTLLMINVAEFTGEIITVIFEKVVTNGVQWWLMF